VNRSAAGKSGEDEAARFLEAAGMRIVARNVRSRRGEIDLVALDGESIVFVEVKAWRRYGIEDLERAIDQRKIGRLIETAKFFLSLNREYNCMSVRFDVVFIDGDGPRHLASAFTERV
jgi:putative endonuclease